MNQLMCAIRQITNSVCFLVEIFVLLHFYCYSLYGSLFWHYKSTECVFVTLTGICE
jgi:hypothetical protein